MKTSGTSQFLVTLAFLSFISPGLPDGLNGVAWPSIRSYFELLFPAWIASAPVEPEAATKIIRLDPRFDEIVPANAASEHSH